MGREGLMSRTPPAGLQGCSRRESTSEARSRSLRIVSGAKRPLIRAASANGPRPMTRPSALTRARYLEAFETLTGETW